MARFTDLKVSELDNGAILLHIINTSNPKEQPKMIALADWTKFVSWLVEEVSPPAVAEECNVVPIRPTPDNVF